jgi:DNA repair photolyase
MQGKPAVILTKLIDDLEKVDILDRNNIAKMEYLSSYDEVLDKNIANRFGASLDIKDKKAQVNNAELKAYDDITTMNYLVNYECRLEFVEKMKEAGFDIEVVVSPIFADEPTEAEIEEPELLDEEPEPSEENTQEENKEENNNEEN